MIYCILGQTASGKTSLSIKLAREFNLPVISADAFQCFKMMQIGTDKPTKDEIKDLDFYFTDEYDPDHEMSVYLFQQECRPIIEKYIKKDKDIIVVGGNFLYVKALLFNYEFQNEDKEVAHRYDDYSKEQLQYELKNRNIEIYNSIDNNNPRRLIRALVQLDTGQDRNEIHKQNQNVPIYDSKFFCLNISKEEGNNKIDARIDKMFNEGFVDEVKRLLNIYPSTLRPFHCIGYDEIITALENNQEIDENVKDLIKLHTHQYAKKQRTFLKSQFPNLIRGSKEEVYNIIKKEIEDKENGKRLRHK